MLKSIIQDKNVRGEFLFHQTAGAPAIGANSSMGVAGVHKDLRLIASNFDGNLCTCLKDDALVDRLSAVAARKNSGLQTALSHALRQIFHHGSLSSAAHPDTSNADHWSVQAACRRNIAALLPARARNPKLRKQPQDGFVRTRWVSPGHS